MARIKKSHQKGCISKRKLKTGEIVFDARYRERTATGWKQKVETFSGLSTEKDAWKKLERILRPINAKNGGQVRSSLTVEQYVEVDWQNYRKNRPPKASTLYTEQSMIKNRIVPYFGSFELEAVSPSDVSTYMSKLISERYSGQYRRNIFVKLKLIFEVAVELGLIEESPVRPIHRPAVCRKEKPIITVDQARKFLESVDEQWLAPIATLMYTGLRSGELCGLLWKHLDLDERRIEVVNSLWRKQLLPPKTKLSASALTVPVQLVSVLKRHKQSSPFVGPDDFVFCREDGSPIDPDSLRRYGIYPALEKAGIPRTPRASGCHLFRHLVGSIIHSATGSLKLAQQQLRHSTISTTGDIYTHVSRPDLESVADVLGKAFGDVVIKPLQTESPEQQLEMSF